MTTHSSPEQSLPFPDATQTSVVEQQFGEFIATYPVLFSAYPERTLDERIALWSNELRQLVEKGLNTTPFPTQDRYLDDRTVYKEISGFHYGGELPFASTEDNGWQFQLGQRPKWHNEYSVPRINTSRYEIIPNKLGEKSPEMVLNENTLSSDTHTRSPLYDLEFPDDKLPKAIRQHLDQTGDIRPVRTGNDCGVTERPDGPDFLLENRQNSIDPDLLKYFQGNDLIGSTDYVNAIMREERLKYGDKRPTATGIFQWDTDKKVRVADKLNWLEKDEIPQPVQGSGDTTLNADSVYLQLYGLDREEAIRRLSEDAQTSYDDLLKKFAKIDIIKFNQEETHKNPNIEDIK